MSKITITVFEISDSEDKAHSEIKELQRAVSKLQHEVYSIMGTIQETEQALADISQKIGAVGQGVENIAGDIGALKAEIQTLNDLIANNQVPQSITDSVSNINSLLDTLSARVNEVAAIVPDPVPTPA